MTTLAPLDDRIVKQHNTVFPNLFVVQGSDISANTVNCINLNSTFVNCDEIQRQTPGDLQINSDTLLVGDLTLDGKLDLTETAGQVRLSNVILANIAGGNSGLHLQIEINNTLYKIKLENA
jgi:hypothetical protein